MRVTFNTAFVTLCLLFIRTAPGARAGCAIRIAPTSGAMNLISNAGFSGGTKGWDAKSRNHVSIGNDDDGPAGPCLKIDSVAGQDVSAYQRVGRGSFKKGATIIIAGWSKAVGVNPDGGSYAVAVRVAYEDGTTGYLPHLVWPKAEIGWSFARIEHPAPKPIKTILEAYVCYYDQTGTAWFDNLFIGSGTTRLNLAVNCPGIKRIQVFNGSEGLVHDSDALDGTKNTYQATVETPALSRCFVRVDAAGGAHTGWYPPGLVQPVGLPDGAVPVTPEQVAALPAATETDFTVDLPDWTGKEVLLRLKARAHSFRHSGYGSPFAIAINGVRVQPWHLQQRPAVFCLADGRSQAISHGDVWVLAYGPSFAPMPPTIGYLPVTLPHQDPYRFVFSVSDLVKPGHNTVTFFNVLDSETSTRPVIVGQAHFVVK